MPADYGAPPAFVLYESDVRGRGSDITARWVKSYGWRPAPDEAEVEAGLLAAAKRNGPVAIRRALGADGTTRGSLLRAGSAEFSASGAHCGSYSRTRPAAYLSRPEGPSAAATGDRQDRAPSGEQPADPTEQPTQTWPAGEHVH